MSNLPAEVQKGTAEYEAKKASFKNTGNFGRPEVMVKKGARFFKDETTGVIMFGFRSSPQADFVDKANEHYREAYPKEWLDYARTLKGKK